MKWQYYLNNKKLCKKLHNYPVDPWHLTNWEMLIFRLGEFLLFLINSRYCRLCQWSTLRHLEPRDTLVQLHWQGCRMSWRPDELLLRFCPARVRGRCEGLHRASEATDGGSSWIGASSRSSMRGFLMFDSGLVRGVTLFLLIKVPGPLFTSSGLSLWVFTASTFREMDSTLHP